MIGYMLLMTGILWITFVMLAGWINRFREDRLSKYMIPFVKVFGTIFVAYDVAYNCTVGTIIFLQIPNPDRLTLTARLKDILRNPPHRAFFFDKIGTWIPMYRYYIAYFFCKTLIEPHDKNHCGGVK